MNFLERVFGSKETFTFYLQYYETQKKPRTLVNNQEFYPPLHFKMYPAN